MMNIFNTHILRILCMLMCATYCECLGITAGGIAAGIATVGIASYKYIKCQTDECCDSGWIKFNKAGLRDELEEKLFGQHLVKRIVLRAVTSHLKKEEPEKALVMSFHGWTGSGKNHVTQIITNNLFQKQQKSSFFHLYIGSKDFVHQEEVNKYRAKLEKDVKDATAMCDRNVFVFDEVDKMTPGVLDAIKPYIDFHDLVDGINYRKNIFIFLGNAGGKEIAKITLNFWSDGENREDIKLKHLEPLISRGVYNEYGGLFHSEIVKKELIDVYVPFLPLEKKHVRECIQSEFFSRNKKVNPQVVKDIADELVYQPPDLEVFSQSGCKKVGSKVDLYLED